MKNLLQVDVTVLAFLSGSVVPLLTGLVTKIQASSRLKALVNLGLSVVSGCVAYLVTVDGSTTVLGLASAAISTYLASGLTYNNLWKPTGVAPAVQQATSDIGIGSPHWEDGDGNRNTPAPS